MGGGGEGECINDNSVHAFVLVPGHVKLSKICLFLYLQLIYSVCYLSRHCIKPVLRVCSVWITSTAVLHWRCKAQTVSMSLNKKVNILYKCCHMFVLI